MKLIFIHTTKHTLTLPKTQPLLTIENQFPKSTLSQNKLSREITPTNSFFFFSNHYISLQIALYNQKWQL